MKRSILLCLFLLPVAASAALTAGSHAQGGDASLQPFWQKFKSAVMSGDRRAVASLSRFPLRMSYGIRSVRNGTELRRRYRQVFNEQSDAARCFEKKQPEVDAADPKRFTVACPNEAGHEVVVYEFARTRAGWKFVALDNLNE